MPDNRLSKALSTLLNLWTRSLEQTKNKKHKSGVFSDSTLSIKKVRQILSGMLDAPVTYDQLNQAIANSPALQGRIKNLDLSGMTVQIPGEEPEAPGEAPAAPEEVPAEAEPGAEEMTAPAAPAAPEPTQPQAASGPGPMQTVAAMAARARERAKKR